MIPRRETSDVPKVSTLLHTLRGEAFRHRRNLLGAPPYAPASPSAQGPSLPPLSTNYSDLDDGSQVSPLHHLPPDSKVAGPSPPRSWIPVSLASTPSATPEWRTRALSLILQCSPTAHSPALAEPVNPRIPSLFQLCLHNLLLKWGGIPPELFPDLPRHILREYVRYSVVHSLSLPRTDLEALWGIDSAGSADGEVIISGLSTAAMLPCLSATSVPPSEWDISADTSDPEPPPALHTLVLLEPSGPLSASIVSAFPPTLTHLALLRVPSIGLHKLPAQLPLIEVLDLSFNDWVVGAIARVEWRRWVHLEVLGLRECSIGVQDVKVLETRVNRGRLNGVEFVF